MGRIRRRFLTTELCLYVGFLLADARCLYGLGTALKYAGILLCVAYAFSNAPHAVFAALFLTAAADLFLLVLNCWLALGVTLFIAVQALYAIHIARDTRRTYEIRAALVLAFWIVLWCLGICTSLNMLAGIYFPQLLQKLFFMDSSSKIIPGNHYGASLFFSPWIFRNAVCFSGPKIKLCRRYSVLVH